MKKPLNGKAYGSIPHLIGSRLGPGDHHLTEGQTKILAEKSRRNDVVYVHEKMDGTNVAVAKLEDHRIVALNRAGYLAESSPYLQHQIFSDWAHSHVARFDTLLSPGERICGEWLAQAHGIRYSLVTEPFVAFDIFSGKNRVDYATFKHRIKAVDIRCPVQFNDQGLPMNIPAVLQVIKSGKATLPICDALPEGAVWCVEGTSARYLFLAKYVRHDFVPGRYLDISDKSGKIIWNDHLMAWLPPRAIQRIKREG